MRFADRRGKPLKQAVAARPADHNPFLPPCCVRPTGGPQWPAVHIYGDSDETAAFDGGTLLLPVVEKRCRSVPSNDETETFARQESSGTAAERRGDEASQGGRAGSPGEGGHLRRGGYPGKRTNEVGRHP